MRKTLFTWGTGPSIRAPLGKALAGAFGFGPVLVAPLPVRADSAGSPSGGLPIWIWLIALLAIVVIALLIVRGRAAASAPVAAKPAATQAVAPGAGPASGLASAPSAPTPAATLLSIIPDLNAEHRWGVAQSILAGVGRQGIGEDTLQQAGVDTGAARAGESKGLCDLVSAAASQSPAGLRDGLASYASNVPSFLAGLPPSAASALKGSLGL